MEPSSVTREMRVYESLWTTQLTQKRKKWNDGVVKFHLFNRRVALYDEDSNFVVCRRLAKMIFGAENANSGLF